MQTKGAEKERKGNLDWFLCGKFKAMSTNAESLCCCEKIEASDEIVKVARVLNLKLVFAN